jgi:hypothetical protein
MVNQKEERPMKTIKGIGIYGSMFLLYVIALFATTFVLAAIPNGILEFCYESIVSGKGKSFYLMLLALQVGLVMLMFGRQIWKQFYMSEANHSKQPQPESDMLVSPPLSQ